MKEYLEVHDIYNNMITKRLALINREGSPGDICRGAMSVAKAQAISSYEDIVGNLDSLIRFLEYEKKLEGEK
jgi:hypothetical protein